MIMIKANELRIGNYLYDSLEDCGYIKVLEIKQMRESKHENISICYKGVNGGYCTTSLQELETNNEPDEYFIQPIPLTEEILLKFPKWFRELISSGYMNLSAIPKEYVDVEYLHTAQNLYFALTGEELKIEI